MRLPRVARALGVTAVVLCSGAVATVAVVVPVTWLSFVSLTSRRGFSDVWEVVWLENYVVLLTSGDWWGAVGNTVGYAVGSCAGQVLMGGAFALLLQGLRRPIRRVVALMLFVPYLVVPSVVAIHLWRFIGDPRAGILPALIEIFGGETLYFFSERWIVLTLVAISTWMFFPFTMLFTLAKLEEIPSHLYETVALEGGRPIELFRYVTLPLIMPTLIAIAGLRLLIMATKFDVPYLVLGTGPLSSEFGPAVIFIYEWAYERMRYGAAAAAALTLSLLLALSVATVLRGFKGGRKARDQ